MAHRALMGLNKHIIRNICKNEQRFKYLLVLDFEATCEKNSLINPQEIIEFPCVAVSTEDWQVKDIFHQYVKPRVHPNLSPFCTDLTGIMQEIVENQPYFPEVLSSFSNWINEGGYFLERGKSAFVTCGDWDLNVMIRSHCATEKLKVPEYFNEWINLKRVFCDATKIFPRGITAMLIHLNLPKIGRLHSGIDDVQNMVNVIRKLATRHNVQFEITSGVNIPAVPVYQRKRQ
ncbi:ERI1 exoribonuclease 3 [Belonocnema kinseyi]|uniref:ERI1 exoribonuclease 3 n=1 Tax=Belonocnema kinseyi TaxID=2817044 RepID=UPI00143CEE1C|nr:ERI1 exoribonuclease 3 [Belonocnema kinseyi]